MTLPHSTTAVETGADSVTGARLVQIDALRGLAAMAVLVYHYTVFALSSDGGPTGFFVGKYGVHIFFMISGCVIAMSAMRQARIVDFLWGRFARLYPAYWVAIAVAVTATFVSGQIPDRELPVEDILLNATMLQSAFDRPNASGAFWTLYVELLFYCFVSVVIASGRISSLPWWLAAAVLIDTIAVFPQAWDRVPGWWRLANVFPLLRHLYLFTFGAWLYRVRSRGGKMLVPVSVLCLLNAYGRGVGFGELAIVAALGCILCAAAFGRLRSLENPWLIGLGTISYSLYLIHDNLGYAIIRTFSSHGYPLLFGQLVATAAALATAVALTFLIERPSHNALRRWWKASRRQLDPVARPSERLESQSAGV